MVAMQVEEADQSVTEDADTVKAEAASKEVGNAQQEDAEMKDAPQSAEDGSGTGPAKAVGIKQEAEKQEEDTKQEGKKEKGKKEEGTKEDGSKESKEKLPEKPVLQLHGKLWPSGKSSSVHSVGSDSSCCQSKLDRSSLQHAYGCCPQSTHSLAQQMLCLLTQSK